MKELQEKAPNEIDWMQKLDDAQQRLLKLANNTINQYNKTSTHMELAELEADAKKIICEPFANGVWPDSMTPLPSVHHTFARICKGNNDAPGTLRYSLKASLAMRERIGQF